MNLAQREWEDNHVGRVLDLLEGALRIFEASNGSTGIASVIPI